MARRPNLKKMVGPSVIGAMALYFAGFGFLCTIALYGSNIKKLLEDQNTLLEPGEWRDTILIPEGGGGGGGVRRALLAKTDAVVAALSAQSYGGCNLTVATPGAPSHVQVPLAEPYKPTRFELSVTCASGTSPSDVALLAVFPTGEALPGPNITFTFKVKEASQIQVYACLLADTRDGICTVDRSRQVFVERVAVVYVRREIRGLTKEESQRYFDTIKILKNHSTAEGQLKYGPKFRSYGELTSRHMAVAWGEYGQCNMGHNGPGFLPFHRAFSREFEQAIQSVDPSVSSTYWDYIADSDLSSPAESDIWSDDYYGSMVGDVSDQYIVKDGQFAYWTVPYKAEAEAISQLTWGKLGPAGVTNPYGFLRSPEVNNRAPYMTRMGNTLGGSLPTQALWASCNEYVYLGDVISCIEKFVHVSAHNIIGGLTGLATFSSVASELNCTMFDSVLECAEAFAEYATYGLEVRSLGVRDGCITCTKECTSLESDPSECGCECLADAPIRCSAYNTMLRFFARTDIPTGWDFADYGLCSTSAYVGDYADVAASVNDPIFWPHHTNVDRLFSSWRLLNPSGNWEDMNFTYPSSNNSVFPDYFSSTNIITPGVMWTGVIPPGDGNPTGICEGHSLYEPTLRATFKGNFRSLPSDHAHTNFELLQSVDTQLTSIFEADYVYDTYQPL